MTATGTQDTVQQALADLAGKYLTFRLDREEYGIEILKVQEIIEMQEITSVPRTPEHVKGVINLRGKVIPVVDLRLTFGLEEKETSRSTCIIVVYVQQAETQVTMGLVVDEVSEVLDIGAEQIEPTPSFGTQVDIRFILGMAKTRNAVATLLDIDSVLTAKEFHALKSVSE